MSKQHNLITFPILHYFFVILGIIVSFFHWLSFFMYLSLTLSRCSNTSGICLLIILPNAQTQLQTIHQLHAASHLLHLTYSSPQERSSKVPILLFHFGIEAWHRADSWDCPELPSWGPVSSVPCFSLPLLSP